LETFKTNILIPLSSQFDILHVKNKQEEKEWELSIFFSKCRKRYPLREVPLNNVEGYGIFEHNHATNHFPPFSRLKDEYQGTNEETKKICFIVEKQPWKY
jgi:hypothetical protein